MPARIDRETFERWVGETVDALPPFFGDRIDNVLFVVEDVPPPEVESDFGEMLLGLYQGVPLPERTVWQTVMQPDVITLYQRNIESICRDRDEVRRQIQETVLHEVGHYFGLDEDELERIEAEWIDRL